VARFDEADLFNTPPDLFVSGRKIPPLPGHQAKSAKCSIGGGQDMSYPKFVDGKPVFGTGKESLVIKTDMNVTPSDRRDFQQVDTKFEFNTKSMVYKGEPDF